MKCPYFERRVSSYRFSGIKCKDNPTGTMGQLREWTKAERDTYIAKHCNGDFESCHAYKNITNRN